MASSSRVAIVTGGSSGIGMALVRDLVSRGWKVVVADVQENEALIQELVGGATYHQCDVSDYYSQAEVFQAVWDKYGRIDALCANAGIVDRSSIFIFSHRGLDEIPPKPNLSCTDIDYKGVIYGTQLAIHFMRKNEKPGGKIVVTASVVAIAPIVSFPEYNGAKAAVVNFVRGTARVLKEKENICINTICPGIVPTPSISQDMKDAFSSDCLTPESTIVTAYNKFLEDDSLFGRVVECSVEKILFSEPPKLANGVISEKTVTVYDPYFIALHGESSGFPEAIR